MTDTEKVKLAQKILLTAFESDPDEGGADRVHGRSVRGADLGG